MFKIGVSLNGIIADWSDQQANGLEICFESEKMVPFLTSDADPGGTGIKDGNLFFVL